MEIEWKWSTILGIILIGIGIVTTILSVPLLSPITTVKMGIPNAVLSGVVIITVVFCIAYIGVGILMFFAAIKNNKQLSVVGLIIGLILFSISLFTSILVMQGLIDLKPEPVPLLYISGEGIDDLPDIYQVMLYYYYGSQFQTIIPSVTLFYFINLISSIASLTAAVLGYLLFEK